MRRILILFFWLFLIAGCDAYNTISYKVANNTSKEIVVVDIKKYRACGIAVGNIQLTDTLFIPPHSERVLFKCIHIGPKSYVKNLVKNQLLLDSILIIYENGSQKLTSRNDSNLWKRKRTTGILIID